MRAVARLRQYLGSPRIRRWSTIVNRRGCLLAATASQPHTGAWWSAPPGNAGGAGRVPEAGRALATLCENYWFPLYAFVRRAGFSAEDAQDLTQEFFVGLLAKNYLAVADPQRGKFRSFLLGAVKHFLANERRRQAARKRGGRQTMISLDFHSGEIVIARSSRPTT